MKNDLIETILSGIALTLGLVFLIASSIVVIGDGQLTNYFPSEMRNIIIHYTYLGVVLSGMIVAASYTLLKMKKSGLSRFFFVAGGVIGIILCGMQVILAQGDLTQIGISGIGAFICYTIIMKGFKR